MAVMAIVAILGAISISLYRDHMVRARLQDAKVALETVRAEEEQFRAEFGRYCPPNTLNFFAGNATVNYGDYQVSMPAQNNSTFTAQATPQTARQGFANSPRYGGWLNINDNGTKSSQAKAGTWP
jgi:Tfp pilus assembly protein PilE